jgi:hypothetical protein
MDENVSRSASARSRPLGCRTEQISPSPAAESIARTIRNAVFLILVLVLCWLAVDVLLIIFAGILLAIFCVASPKGSAELAAKRAFTYRSAGPWSWRSSESC